MCGQTIENGNTPSSGRPGSQTIFGWIVYPPTRSAPWSISYTVLVSQTIFVWIVYPPTRSAPWSLYTYCLYLPIRSRVPIALESFDYICLNRSVLQNLPHSFGIVSCCGSLHENNRGIEYTVRTLQ